MDTPKLIVLIVTIVLAVIGWIVSHFLSSRREILQKRREIRIKYLRDAFMKLSHVADTGGDLITNISPIQTALNDIQLFGDLEQIRLVKKLVTDLNSGSGASMDELLKQLRNEIRHHLRLPKTEGLRWHIRLQKGNSINDSKLRERTTHKA